MKNKWIGLLFGASLIALVGCNTSSDKTSSRSDEIGAASGSGMTSVTPSPSADTSSEPSGGMGGGAGSGSSTTAIPVEDNSTRY